MYVSVFLSVFLFGFSSLLAVDSFFLLKRFHYPEILGIHKGEREEEDAEEDEEEEGNLSGLIEWIKTHRDLYRVMLRI